MIFLPCLDTLWKSVTRLGADILSRAKNRAGRSPPGNFDHGLGRAGGELLSPASSRIAHPAALRHTELHECVDEVIVMRHEADCNVVRMKVVTVITIVG